MNGLTTKLLRKLGDRSLLVVMPISRLNLERENAIGEFILVPPGELEVRLLRPVSNLSLLNLPNNSAIDSVGDQPYRDVATLTLR